jgi:hypothetical protein
MATTSGRETLDSKTDAHVTSSGASAPSGSTQFCELRDTAGAGTFDVLLQGETVLADLNVSEQAGGYGSLFSSSAPEHEESETNVSERIRNSIVKEPPARESASIRDGRFPCIQGVTELSIQIAIQPHNLPDRPSLGKSCPVFLPFWPPEVDVAGAMDRVLALESPALHNGMEYRLTE